MCRCKRLIGAHEFLTFPTFAARLGRLQALRRKGVPNLPNLPHLILRARAHVCTGLGAQACARARVYTTHFRLGRLGRLGTSSARKAFRVPNLFLTSARLGT